MRKSISVCEGGTPTITKNCKRVKALLKELNTMSRKIDLLIADDEMGDADKSKIGGLDDLAVSIETSINILSKL